jgi:hypothetical protein
LAAKKTRKRAAAETARAIRFLFRMTSPLLNSVYAAISGEEEVFSIAVCLRKQHRCNAQIARRVKELEVSEYLQ